MTHTLASMLTRFEEYTVPTQSFIRPIPQVFHDLASISGISVHDLLFLSFRYAEQILSVASNKDVMLKLLGKYALNLGALDVWGIVEDMLEPTHTLHFYPKEQRYTCTCGKVWDNPDNLDPRHCRIFMKGQREWEDSRAVIYAA